MKPPAVARAIVRLFSDAEDRAFLLEDLSDGFQDVCRTQGPRAAKRWYWSQALSVVPSALRMGAERIRWRSWAGMVGDLRFGVRTLRRSPLYASGVAGTLGLGVAAAMITFAVAWKVWLAPMSYPDPDRVVRLYELEPADQETGASEESRRRLLSPTLLGDINAHSWRTIEAVSAVMRGEEGEPWIRDGETQRISRIALSPAGFGILGIVPELGRLPSGQTEMLITERFWQRAFGEDPDVIGSAMNLGWGIPQIVGVVRLPSGYPGDADIIGVGDWGMTETEEAREFRWVEAIARLKPGYSVAQARAEVNAFVAALGEIHPEHRGWGADVVVLADDLMRPFRSTLALLLAAGTMFLLLAGVNVLGLVAARRVEGRRDRSIRLALGSSEGRLLRGSLIESLLLAIVGSITGALSAYWLISPLRAMVPQDVPRLADAGVSPDLAIGGIAVGIALGIVIGLVGYLVSRGAKPSVGRAPVWRAVGVGGRRALVVGQVALTTLLTAGGASVLHRVFTLRAIDLGFDPERVSTTSTILTRDRYTSAEMVRNTRRGILDGLAGRRIRAAIGINTPMSGEDLPSMPPMSIRADAASETVFVELHPVSADYFSVMGIDVLAGRVFGPEDRAQRVVIVSEEFVAQYFPPNTSSDRVVGRTLAPMPGDTIGMTVVGVVRSTRHQGPALPAMPEMYIPLSQFTNPPVTLLLRGEPDQVAEAVSEVVAQVDPDLRWTPVLPYTSHLKAWYAPLRLQLLMIGVLGVLGLLLASLGLYALMAYQVASRRQELGIRKAVGATDGKLVWGVLASAMTMSLLGALIGLGAWYRLLPFSREFVDGIDSAGPIVPLSVALVVGSSCVLATLVPALRVSKVDPVVTLNSE